MVVPVETRRAGQPVRAAREGEPDAWDALFKRYQLPLYAYVYELIHDEQGSLDIVQESFINAVKHIGQLKHDEKFGSWLFGIAHQKVVQHWRKQARETEKHERHFEETDAPNEDPAEWLIRKEDEERFMKTLEQLPAPHRSVLLLHFIEGFKLEEIARITGAPVGTVKSRLYHAKQTLRNLLKGKSL